MVAARSTTCFWKCTQSTKLKLFYPCYAKNPTCIFIVVVIIYTRILTKFEPKIISQFLNIQLLGFSTGPFSSSSFFFPFFFHFLIHSHYNYCNNLQTTCRTRNQSLRAGSVGINNSAMPTFLYGKKNFIFFKIIPCDFHSKC